MNADRISVFECLPRREPQGGFTLVELLIVISLLSLIMLALGSALRTTAQTEERVDARLHRTDELRVANGFLRSVLGRISAQKTGAMVAADASPFFFSGSSGEMVWVGVMPARYGAGGRYHFRLGLMDGEGGTRTLMLQYVPWVDAAVQPNWGQAASYALVTGVTALSMQYGDFSEEPPVWTQQWSVIDRLPQRVIISLQTVSGPWPEFVVAMRTMPGSDPASGGAVFGGGRR